jgi:uncharacterized protein (TIGR00290 family)
MKFRRLRNMRYPPSSTVTRDYGRISMHGVRQELLEQQAACLGYPLEKVFISKSATNEEYESQMRDILEKYLKTCVTSVVFGDIFLEDLRKYREANLAKLRMNAVFPLWKRDTTELAHAFIDSNFKAVITCIDSKMLDKGFVGRFFDEQFLSELPLSIDPCGENGEFHSFVFDGPIFRKKLSFKQGKIAIRESRFYFCDLMPLAI